MKSSIEVRGVTVAQAPNPPLIVAGAAAVGSRLTTGPAARASGIVSNLALLVWAFLEIKDGVNLFRRALGVSGVLTAGASLLRLLRARPEPDHHADPQPPGEPAPQPPPLPE